MPVAADVAVLGADHDEHEILIADVDDLARRLRLDVRHAARPELARLAGKAKLRPAAVDEIELVLVVVEVGAGLDPGRENNCVGAEGCDSEPLSDLAKDAVAELVHGRKRVPHGR